MNMTSSPSWLGNTGSPWLGSSATPSTSSAGACIIMVDGDDLALIEIKPAAIVDVFAREARHAMYTLTANGRPIVTRAAGLHGPSDLPPLRARAQETCRLLGVNPSAMCPDRRFPPGALHDALKGKAEKRRRPPAVLA